MSDMQTSVDQPRAKALFAHKTYADGRKPRPLGLLAFYSPNPIENFFGNALVQMCAIPRRVELAWHNFKGARRG